VRGEVWNESQQLRGVSARQWCAGGNDDQQWMSVPWPTGVSATHSHQITVTDTATITQSQTAAAIQLQATSCDL
jgi:hypothetical protein